MFKGVMVSASHS